jgi:glycogen(starch) synthase
MKILMLGWEYPPHITGGLGTACDGLTRALARLDIGVQFVVPVTYGDEDATHMRLSSAEGIAGQATSSISQSGGYQDVNNGFPEEVRLAASPNDDAKNDDANLSVSTNITPLSISPYWSPEAFKSYLSLLEDEKIAPNLLAQLLPNHLVENYFAVRHRSSSGQRYSKDIFEEVGRFAHNTVGGARNLDFDIIHAHDWMTFPAAVALKKLTGKPLIVHVHSLEYDRAGAGGNEIIRQIESLGLHNADGIIAVSYYTRDLICREHGVSGERITVVHNGVYPRDVRDTYRSCSAHKNQKIVLFLGRVTFQKGPDYFVEAAASVVPHVPEVLFVMAGAGDMLPRMIQRVQELGIERNFEFTGFLKGEEVERIFTLADLYVMPSVSEPFGITALEAISHDTPVIISRQSGVAEVLHHSLKVDFWDTHRMADLMINGLIHDELRESMVSMAREELKKVRWDASAMKVESLYRSILF